MHFDVLQIRIGAKKHSLLLTKVSVGTFRVHLPGSEDDAINI